MVTAPEAEASPSAWRPPQQPAHLARPIDCCTDNSCVARHFGGVSYTNAVGNTVLSTGFHDHRGNKFGSNYYDNNASKITTVTTLATTVAPYSVYAHLQQECRGLHLEPGICNDLKETYKTYASRTALAFTLTFAPEMRSVCQAMKEANCHDTVLDGECAKLMAEKDISAISYRSLHSSLFITSWLNILIVVDDCPVSGASCSLHTCPVSCGLRDALVEEKLVAIFDRKEQLPISNSRLQLSGLQVIL
ncbi:hypothetical protein RRG08_030687 [Elysia crispata]|uniref:Uncharacterized protein n=1 Tax=Elysia crispata TaxID=231223 RepID=A0AAE0Y5R1_9GAST|nr:hypothetical protein RRG08_030687 [Elysia crispata]